MDVDMSDSPTYVKPNIPRHFTFEFNLYNLLNARPGIKFVAVDKSTVEEYYQIAIERGLRDVIDKKALENTNSRLYSNPVMSTSMRQIMAKFFVRHGVDNVDGSLWGDQTSAKKRCLIYTSSTMAAAPRSWNITSNSTSRRASQ